ncbi:MAG: hypothetical protein K2J80_02565, partial [Oscillospiraceae bacterium]|nr:hypothetical protein [Oscillospiraceae bacterium]
MSRTFAAASVSADMLLRALCIFAVPYIVDEPSEHLRKIFCDEIGTFDVSSADITHIKMYATSAGRIFCARICTTRFTVLEILTTP